MAKPKSDGQIDVPAINLKQLTMRIIGTAPLMMHKWSEKAKRQIREKQQKKTAANKKKEARNPEQEFLDATYHVSDFPGGAASDKRYAFPAIAFKKAAVDACRQLDNITMALAKTMFHVIGEYVIIESENEPIMREDTVVIGQGTTDLRYRPQFWPWAATIEIVYNADVVSKEQIANIFKTAGFASGIGENRPSKTGNTFGMFSAEVLNGKA